MRVLSVVLGMALVVAVAPAQDVVERARQLEAAGNSGDALKLLKEAAAAQDASVAVLEAHAEFLNNYGSADARPAFERLLGLLRQGQDLERRAAVARRLTVLSLTDGDHAAAEKYLKEYRDAGGKDWPQASLSATPPAPEARETIRIPGPMRSFMRMAAVSQDTQPQDLLVGLARSVGLNGYQTGDRQGLLEPTEYMKLLTRYISQARELEKLSGAERTIRVERCESDVTGEVLRILGYRMRGGCGSEVVLETVNATRAFLTIDSGFPLAELEQALRTNRPFTLDYRPTEVPILWDTGYWMGDREKKEGEFIDAFIGDPSLCRFYVAMSKLDPETAEQLRKAVPSTRLKAFSHVLDFYGAMFQIRNGAAVVPGGARTASMWEDLVGESPNDGPAFFERLISKDDGWLASYFDALLRIQGPVRDYLTEPRRLERFYTAIRGRVTSPGPARPVFRANTDMILLTTRLRMDADGRPHVPGGIEVWRDVFLHHPRGRYDAKLTRLAKDWREPDDLIEALFALCRRSTDNEPLRMFMALSDFDRHRERPLSAATAARMVKDFVALGPQYSILSEAPLLEEATIVRFLDYAIQVDKIRNRDLQADTAGTFQGTVGLWQVLCGQGAIPAARADSTLAGILDQFEGVRNEAALFDAGRASVRVLLQGAGVGETDSPQEQLLGLLAGSLSQAPSDVQALALAEVQTIFDAQRLVPLTVLFQLADHLDSLERGEKLDLALVGRVTARLTEIGAARAAMTAAERNSLSYGYSADQHVERQRRLNLRSVITRAGTDPDRLRNVRSQLAPLLRDALVGLNYAYYAPPGAQLLRSNPVFVRSHDFLGARGGNATWQFAELLGSGWPVGAGGRLTGSLAGLPYALGDAEQNFLVPSREQALIWSDLVPQMILSAKVPRWWNVSPAQMHWVGLHLRYGDALVAEAALDAASRSRLLESIAEQATPARVHEVARLLGRAEVSSALKILTPSELFLVARRALERDPGSAEPLARSIRRVATAAPDRVNYAAASRAFGTPKPSLTGSYRPELLNLRTLPTLMGYSSRMMAESWESNTIYWAGLADELHLRPSELNLVIPEWTRAAAEQIFATHLEDWPAVLRSLYQVGDQIRAEAQGRPESAEGLARLNEGGRP